jgi:hypothetical protein
MLVEVHFTGDSFIAFGPDGSQIKDRGILDQIAFTPFPGFKSFYRVEVKAPMAVPNDPLNIVTNVAVRK